MAVSMGPVLNTIGWLFWCMAAVAIGFRLAASRARGHGIRIDDFVMILSLAFNLFAAIFTSVAVAYGLGQHISDLASTPETLPSAAFWSIIANVFCLFADSVPKLGVALLVNRILIPRPFMRAFHIALVSTLIAFTTVVFVISFVQCQPVAHQWNPNNVPGSCWDPRLFERLGLADGVLASFVDLYFSVYPPIIISRLNMALKKKVVVGIIMSLGLFAFFTTLYKTVVTLPQLLEADADITWVYGQVLLWGLLEASATIIAGSIPTWGWLFRTESFRKLVTWISVHSPRLSKSAARTTSQGSRNRIEMDNMPLEWSTERAFRSYEPSATDSIAELARSAAR